MSDLIDRQAAIDALHMHLMYRMGTDSNKKRLDDWINGLPSTQPEITLESAIDYLHSIGWMQEHDRILTESAQPEPQWIPFKTRPLTKEEKEEYPEWDCILDCKLPDNGQRILVAIRIRGHEEVQQDEFYSDDDSYLDSGYEIGTEAVAWMPLPEPYRGERTEE